MLPTLKPGSLLVAWRWARPRPGRIVVARVDGRPVVKRIAKLGQQGMWLVGDNPALSRDSRHSGWVPVTDMEAVCIGISTRV